MVNTIVKALVASSMMISLCFANTAAPYTGQQSRKIKALSEEDVHSYLSGKGMGFAKAAELNGFPGPSHVLSLSRELELTSDQRHKTKFIFEKMETDAISLGRRLVEEEQRLDHAFSSKSITSASLDETMRTIGELQAKLRQVHLAAHLEQVQILTPKQISVYNELRGYGQKPGTKEHTKHAH